MHQCWHDQRPYDEDTPWRVTSNEMNSSTESEGSHCKPSLASVAVPPCSARARASSYCLKARVLPTPGSARAHAWQRPSKTPQRPQPALQRYPIPLTKDPSHRGDRMRRASVRAFRLHVRGIAKSKTRPRLAAGRPPLRKGSEVSRKKSCEVRSRVRGGLRGGHRGAPSTARHGIVHRCRRWIDLCTPRPQR